MIRVRKPARPPKVLAEEGAPLKDALCDAYDSGERAFKFDARVYGHETVKQALIRTQRGKCAFCESKFEHVAFGDVEHFRPKAGSRQTAKARLEKPGYFWLAYEWANLYAACEICNRSFKGNRFPLADPAQRARKHGDDLARETPLLVDPGVDDPEAFITFRAEVPRPKEGNERGRVTIKTLGLDRPAMNERRRERYEALKQNHDIIKLAEAKPEILPVALWPQWEQIAEEARRVLARAVTDGAEYAAMARCATADAFTY